MTRIIGGRAGGRRIRAPSGRSTRPTSDRVREALFSTLESSVGSLAGLRFLDLYAGSGAVGLEGVSRGVGRLTLVERDRRAAALIRDNVRTLGFARVEVDASAVSRALVHPPSAPYDIVFLDPPYTLPSDEVGRNLAALRAHGWLAHAAVIVVERGARTDPVAWPEGLYGDRAKEYGETTLWYGHAASTSASGRG